MRLKRNYKFVRYRDAGRAQPQADATPAPPEPALQTRLSLTGTFQAVWHPTSHRVPAVNGLGLQALTGMMCWQACRCRAPETQMGLTPDSERVCSCN